MCKPHMFAYHITGEFEMAWLAIVPKVDLAKFQDVPKVPQHVDSAVVPIRLEVDLRFGEWGQKSRRKMQA
jgi:hypothetical protein